MSYTTAIRVDRELRPPHRRFDVSSMLMLVAFLAIAWGVAAFGTVTTIAEVRGFYAHIARVPWTPPNWAFGAVWSVLYTAIGVSGWLVWRRRDRFAVRGPLTLFVVQLAVNSLWTPVFFGGHSALGSASLWAGLAVILLLDLLVAATIAAMWPVSRPAALLLVPYLAWILYASSLNWGDAALNALA